MQLPPQIFLLAQETESVFERLNWIPSGFGRAWVLWFMLIPIFVLAWIWLRRTGGVAIPVDHSIHKSGTVTRTLINLAESLAPIVGAIAIWILAQPLELGQPTEKRSLTNIQFCVDISGSMTASFGEGTRYDASMVAINQFLDFREGDAFGLSFFGNSVLHWCPLTTDTSAIRCSPPFMRPEVVPPWFGGTEIGKALLECRRELMKQDDGDRMIILVSDGSSSDLYGGKDAEIAYRLSDQGIKVYGIHIADYEVPDEVITITSITGGEVFNPGDPDSLASVFQQIDEMEKAQVEQTVAEQLDNFKPFAMLGVGFLFLFLLSRFGLRYTPW
jgi:Ca-activated chloride channel family protein